MWYQIIVLWSCKLIIPTYEKLVFFHVRRAENRFTPRLLLSHIHPDTRSVPHMTTRHVYPSDFHPTHPVCGSIFHCSRLYLPEQVQTLFPLQLFMDTVKEIPAHVLLFCYQHLAALSFLKWMGKKRREDGKSADKCRAQRRSHTKRNLPVRKSFLDVASQSGRQKVVCWIQYKAHTWLLKRGHLLERHPSWCHPEGSALKGMGAQGHPGITIQCCMP